MDLTIAMALNDKGEFTHRHFGDADKFGLYLLNEHACEQVSEIPNPRSTPGHHHEHGLEEKGRMIMELLGKHNVNVLISRQFGPNVRFVANDFVPVIVHRETVEEVCRMLVEYHHWLEDELGGNKEIHRKFTIRDGIMKSDVVTY